MSVSILILNFLKNNWLPLTVSMIFLIMYLYIGNLKSDIEDLAQDLEKARVDISSCRSTIEDRNGIIEVWSNKTSGEALALEKLRKEVKDSGIASQRAISRMLKRKGPDTCAGAIEYLIDLGTRYE